MHLAEAVRKAVGVPVRAVGMIDDARQAEAIVPGGRADMVALARAILADPRWPWRAAATLGHAFKTAPQLARATSLHKHWVAALARSSVSEVFACLVVEQDDLVWVPREADGFVDGDGLCGPETVARSMVASPTRSVTIFSTPWFSMSWTVASTGAPGSTTRSSGRMPKVSGRPSVVRLHSLRWCWRGRPRRAARS